MSALTLLIGWESMIVLEDIRALSPVEAEEVCVWTSRTLLLATERELTQVSSSLAAWRLSVHCS